MLLGTLSLTLFSLLSGSTAHGQTDPCAGQFRVSIEHTFGSHDLVVRRVSGGEPESDIAGAEAYSSLVGADPPRLSWLGDLDRDPYVDAILSLGQCGNHGDCLHAAVAGCGDGTFRVVSPPDYSQYLGPTDRWLSGWRELATGQEYTCRDSDDGIAGGVQAVYLVHSGDGYVVSGRASGAVCDDRDLSQERSRYVPRRTILIAPLIAEGSVVRGLVLSPDGSRLLWPGEPSRVLDVSDGRTIASLEHPSAETGTWTPDGRTLVVCDREGHARFVDPATGRTLATIEDAVTGGCSGIAVSPDGRWLSVVGYLDRSITVWDVASRVIRRSETLPTEAGQPDRVWIDDGGHVVVATLEGALVSAEEGRPPLASAPGGGRIFDLVRDRRRGLARTFGESRMVFWQFAPGSLRWLGQDAGDGRVAFLSDAELGPHGLVAWCTREECVVERRLAMADEAIAEALEGRPPAAPLASLVPPERLLVIPWSRADAPPEGHPAGLALSRDAGTLYVATTSGRLLVFRVPSPARDQAGRARE